MMESYVASVVAEVAQYDAVRLSCPPEQAPDFYLRKGNVELAVEVGEALETGRKRGDEKWDDFELVFDPASKWLERADQIPSQLNNAVKHKLEKEYAINDLCLAIYLNIGEFGIRQKMVEACLHDQTEAAKSKFKIVWVLWKNKLYELWCDGERSQRYYTLPAE